MTSDKCLSFSVGARLGPSSCTMNLRTADRIALIGVGLPVICRATFTPPKARECRPAGSRSPFILRASISFWKMPRNPHERPDPRTAGSGK